MDKLVRRVEALQRSAAYIEADDFAALNGTHSEALRLRREADKLWRQVLEHCSKNGIQPPPRP